MKCLYCGEEIDNDSVYCEFCGKKQERDKQAQGGSFLKRYGLKIVIGTLAVIVILLVAFILNRSSEDTPPKDVLERRVHILMDKANKAMENGRNYDIDYHEWRLMDAYMFYEVAKDLAMQSGLKDLTDSIAYEQSAVVHELQDAVTRLRGQQEESEYYKLPEASLYCERADSVETFLRKKGIFE